MSTDAIGNKISATGRSYGQGTEQELKLSHRTQVIQLHRLLGKKHGHYFKYSEELVWN